MQDEAEQAGKQTSTSATKQTGKQARHANTHRTHARTLALMAIHLKSRGNSTKMIVSLWSLNKYPNYH